MQKIKTERKFNYIEKKIISILYVAAKPLPIQRIAKQLDINRITAKKYLLSLEKDKIVKSRKEGRAVWYVLG